MEATTKREPGRAGSPNAEAARIQLERIDQNPHQPRRTFDDDELNALRDSIQLHGVLQPLVVRRTGERFQVVAGERRLRAAKAAGLPEVPVQIIDLNDQQVLEAALVENIHRADLNPIEKAQGFKDYLDRFKMTHEQLAARLHLARTTITNLVGLLELPAEVQNAVRVGQLTVGHAKLLKGIEDSTRQLALTREIIARGLSVHATEALMKLPPPGPAPTERPPREVPEKTNHVKGIEDELRQKFSTRVEVKLKGEDRGQIVVSFETNEEFERILEFLRK